MSLLEEISTLLSETETILFLKSRGFTPLVLGEKEKIDFGEGQPLIWVVEEHVKKARYPYCSFDSVARINTPVSLEHNGDLDVVIRRGITNYYKIQRIPGEVMHGVRLTRTSYHPEEERSPVSPTSLFTAPLGLLNLFFPLVES